MHSVQGDDAWEKRAPLKNARGDKAIVVLPHERLLVVGGETHNRGRFLDRD